MIKKITTWPQWIETQKSWKLIRQARSRVKATPCVMSRIHMRAACDRPELNERLQTFLEQQCCCDYKILSSKCILTSYGLALTTDTSLMYQLHQRTTCISLLVETCRHKPHNKWRSTFRLHVHLDTIQPSESRKTRNHRSVGKFRPFETGN
jgi:hypothetical protein